MLCGGSFPRHICEFRTPHLFLGEHVVAVENTPEIHNLVVLHR